MDYQEVVFGIIVNSGDARSYAMEAIRKAKTGNMEEAKSSLEKSSEALGKSHDIQTKLIQEEANGNGQDLTLLMAHAQDHFMNALTVRDLAKEFIDLYETLEVIKVQVKKCVQ